MSVDPGPGTPVPGGQPTNTGDTMRTIAADTRHGPARGSAREHRGRAGHRRRARREWKTVRAMVEMYCQHHHRGGAVCPECQALLEYVRRRLDRCPFGIDRPTCAQCPIHCYRATERQRIREIMRWAGPRMTWRHPVLALVHLMRDRWLSGKVPPRTSALRTSKHTEGAQLREAVQRR
ncbi:MAG: nitrous oxide-stimulated promoter family protein [Polyangiaceae bacterium]|nr:nitrous oxide-stimulated promoter family protein [Polyangiaceae bacterium]